MVTLFQLFRRAEGLTRAEFQEHWLECHSRHGRGDPAVRGYTQFHTLLDDSAAEANSYHEESKGLARYDGVATMIFDDMAAAHRALSGDHFAAAKAEEPVFVDQARSTMALVRERVIIAPDGDAPIAIVECAKGRAGIDYATFDRHWIDHGETGKRHAAYIAGYIQYPPATGVLHDPGIPNLPVSAERWDGFAVGYFSSIAIFKALGKRVMFDSVARDEEVQFLDPGAFVNMLAHRRVVKHLVR